MGLNQYANNIRNTSREVPAPAVIQHTMDDLDMVAEALHALTDSVADYLAPTNIDHFTKALGVLEYRRHCLARWIRQQEDSEPALRAEGRNER